MKETVNYEQFKLRDDNRDGGVTDAHVRKIVASIKLKNMLEFRPIIVNEHMEVIDGQHRLAAAKELKVPIYYEIHTGAAGAEIIGYNLAKAWMPSDYLNYYCEHDYPHYKKLREFMKNQSLSLQSAMCLCTKKSKHSLEEFRLGKFIFNDEYNAVSFEVCLETIDKIKTSMGFSHFTKSSRFWKALIRITTHDDFNEEKWFKNMSKFIERFCPKATTKDYLKLFLEVHNFQNQNKILITESEYFPKDDFIAPKQQEDTRQLQMQLESR